MGRAAPLEPNTPTLIGTDPACDLVLRDERVSRRHLSITARPDGRFSIKDLESRNGTLFEGSIVQESAVPAGATVKLGRSFVRIQPRPTQLDIPPSRATRFGDLVGVSLSMRELFAVLTLAAPTEVTVLLEGETGTGKELAARALHEASPRREGPFVAIDCGALPENLLESELFGHQRGAFTGAVSHRAGAFLRAHGGTLFLDELGNLSMSAQARLLRVLEERKVKPVGSDQERPVDVRVIGASRLDLSARVAEGGFRPDLFYRLAVVRVSLPPLRARREDLGPIVQELLRRRGMSPGPIHGPNLDRLTAHAWPGNVRELRNVIDRALALSPGANTFAALRLSVGPTTAEDDELAPALSLPFVEAKQQLIERFERRYLKALVDRAGQNLSEAARLSGLDRKHLRLLLRRYGLSTARPDDEG